MSVIFSHTWTYTYQQCTGKWLLIELGFVWLDGMSWRPKICIRALKDQSWSQLSDPRPIYSWPTNRTCQTRRYPHSISSHLTTGACPSDDQICHWSSGLALKITLIRYLVAVQTCTCRHMYAGQTCKRMGLMLPYTCLYMSEGAQPIWTVKPIWNTAVLLCEASKHWTAFWAFHGPANDILWSQ